MVDMKEYVKGLTITELRQLRRLVPKEIDLRSRKENGKLIKELKARANAVGAKLIFGDVRAERRVLYRHPSYPNLVWSGAGRRPKWVSMWFEQHGNLDGARIRNQMAAAQQS